LQSIGERLATVRTFAGSVTKYASLTADLGKDLAVRPLGTPFWIEHKLALSQTNCRIVVTATQHHGDPPGMASRQQKHGDIGIGQLGQDTRTDLHIALDHDALKQLDR
jgi:hypothetical protein